MPKVVFHLANGGQQVVEAHSGASAMHTALTNAVPGIVADCGGAASCATCHVYVAADWLERVGPPGEDESDMLDCTASERRPESRLSCQIALDDDLDGLELTVPGEQ